MSGVLKVYCSHPTFDLLTSCEKYETLDMLTGPAEPDVRKPRGRHNITLNQYWVNVLYFEATCRPLEVKVL